MSAQTIEGLIRAGATEETGFLRHGWPSRDCWRSDQSAVGSASSALIILRNSSGFDPKRSPLDFKRLEKQQDSSSLNEHMLAIHL